MAKIYAHNFEFWGSPRVPPPKGKKISPGPMCATVQNSTLIGAIVAEIIVIGQRKKNNQYTLPCQRMAGNKLAYNHLVWYGMV